MKRFLLSIILMTVLGFTSFAQKMMGYGGELSMLSIKPNMRIWISKSTGFEVFTGIASQLENIKPNDLEFGFKYLHTLIYNLSDRTYIGIVGKWKWVDFDNPNISTNLPIPGIMIGKEWYNKKIKRRGFALELGYQYGVKSYNVKNFLLTPRQTFTEYPLILNIRYTFYRKR